MLNAQFLLRVAGIAALVVSALFAVLAVHYYLTKNIRAVMDDLSGKTRAQGVASTRGRAATGRAQATAPRRQARGAKEAAPTPATGEVIARMGTSEGLLTSSAQHVAQASAMVKSDDKPVSNDMASIMGRAAPYPEKGGAATLDEPYAPTIVEGGASGVEQTQPAVFRLTRSIVMIHSQEVIATNEELLA